VVSGLFRGHQLGGFGPIAVDPRGNIDVAGFNGWSIWQVGPDGAARQVGPGSGARLNGGGDSLLERAPNGAVYAENGAAVLRLTGFRLVPTFTFRTAVHGDYFWLTHFAFAPDGTIYADELPGDAGFEALQLLLSVSHRHINFLWQETR